MIKIEDIIFWILIIAIIAIALWLISGSPPEIDALITIAFLLSASELLIWRKMFSIENNFNLRLSNLDKNTTLGFMKVKNDLEKIDSKINNINSTLNEISEKIKK